MMFTNFEIWTGKLIPLISIPSYISNLMTLMKYRPAKRGGENDTETPLMKQYGSIKTKYPDAILLFRIGDFYETFGEDAIKTAATLGITLTKRRN